MYSREHGAKVSSCFYVNNFSDHYFCSRANFLTYIKIYVI